MDDILIRIASAGMLFASLIVLFVPAYWKFSWPLLALCSGTAAVMADTWAGFTFHVATAAVAAQMSYTELRKAREAA
ncbi:hypothetical protein [Streptomyces sp. SP18CM02]|uniref:hypothetical protein n=1 Tax=Streptomyces sp. SP18CM02 TaxID=2758571 RepID=UPI00168B6666|nr:hypothetical protein [Streptomyces sp. SP18CM02]MBD3550860.1 hypothetical protein [Streptomyces sp. SP18CM02]